jgi:hypothetical protein
MNTRDLPEYQKIILLNHYNLSRLIEHWWSKSETPPKLIDSWHATGSLEPITISWALMAKSDGGEMISKVYLQLFSLIWAFNSLSSLIQLSFIKWMASCGEDVDKMRVHFTTSPVPRKYTKYPVGITPRYISSLTPGRLAKFLPTAVGSWPSRIHPTRMVTLNLDLVSVRVISSRIGRTSTNQRTNKVYKKQLNEAKYESEEICNW